MSEYSITCHDGSIPPMIATQNDTYMWDLFGVSEVHGMGSANYKNKLFPYSFTNIEILNSFRNISYVCLQKGKKWGLLELTYNETAACEWKLVVDFTFDQVDDMLGKYGVKRSEFMR